ncbi:MAG: glycosyltransferase [Lachnospiraceae bacterium]|nr:glycosyltransferase [Lachnospiraceae bacterium]
MIGKKKDSNRKAGKPIEDVLLKPKEDRRLLSYVPDKQQVRNNMDRRGGKTLETYEGKADDYIKTIQSGIRYRVDYEVKVCCKGKRGWTKFTCRGIDISSTGILLEMKDEDQQKIMQEAQKIRLAFEIIPGSMPEGYEMKVKQKAKLVRSVKTQDDKVFCGMEFDHTLAQYATRKKDGYMLTIASFLIFFISSFIVMMRAESVIYFKFNKWLYLYSIIAAAFLLSRYLFGALYRPVPIDKDFTPGVTIIIPCFNEEEWIRRTILSCVNQDYPVDKLEVIVVDDCSTDHSVEQIKETIEVLKKENEHYDIESRVSYLVQPKNAGKRDALCEGAKIAKHELIVFVDSDSFLDPFAIRNLVQPFKDPKMGGVAGRTDVANTYTNSLTKMQSVRYYIAFRVMKAAEAYFDGVTCLSGPLSCYRREIIMENMDAWLNQKFLGQKATFGDDRAMTNFVLRHHRTGYQDTAICSTIVPNQHKVFLKQQMRWKRSWLRESIMAGKFMWRKEPFMAVFFYIGLIVPVAAPVVVLYNLVYVPITQRIFPTTFLVGLFLMSFIMSVVQLLLRKSSTWIYGMLFCIYYELVLLWQMPVAWVTFWKSTWGTRMTPEDVKEKERKEKRKQGRKGGTADEATT